MGARLTVGGTEYPILSYSVSEDATPLAAGDSSGSTGTITVSIPSPDPHLQSSHPVLLLGPQVLLGQSVSLEDTSRGSISGRVHSVSGGLDSDTINLTCLTRLEALNIYNVQANPFIGTLGNAFRYYLSLAGITTGVSVDSSVESRNVRYPGWSGELWDRLKQLAVAEDVDIRLISGVITLSPVRTETIHPGFDFSRTVSGGGDGLARGVEVYYYNTRAITNQMVYPPGGWSEDVSVINVNAGETVSEVLELSASVSSIQAPTMVTFIGKNYSGVSAYTVTGDDGLPIVPAMWNAFGGRLTVEINPDTTSLTVHITAPVNIPNSTGGMNETFGISLSDSSATGRYSTLRIRGTGVAFEKEIRRVETGVSDSETSNDVGITVDNPFVRTRGQAARIGIRATRRFNDTSLSISGDVSQISPSDTVGFGSTAGARVWDSRSGHWYRVTEADTSPDGVSFSGDIDTTYRDVRGFYPVASTTYQDIANLFVSRTYRSADLAGQVST